MIYYSDKFCKLYDQKKINLRFHQPFTMIHLKIGQLKLSPKTIKLLGIGCFINVIELGIISTTTILESTQWGIYAILLALYLPWAFLGPRIWREMEPPN